MRLALSNQFDPITTITIIAIALIPSQYIVSASKNPPCYTPNGTVTDDVPCRDSEGTSVCCTYGFLCMSNGFRQSAGNSTAGIEIT